MKNGLRFQKGDTMNEFDNNNYMNGQNGNNNPNERNDAPAENISPEFATRGEKNDFSAEPQETSFERQSAPEPEKDIGTYSHGYEGGTPDGRAGYSYNHGGRPYGVPQDQVYRHGDAQRRDAYSSAYTNPQNAGYRNSYVPSYETPRQDGDRISYTPYNAKTQKKKEKKPVTRASVAILCCLAVLLSGISGFGGAYIANRMSSDEPIEAVQSGGVASGDSIIIYRDVENVSTSAEKNNGEALDFEEVAAIVKDSVVEITTEYNMQSMWYQYVTEGAGSGVIISENGHIITNSHVICDEDTGKVADSIRVRLTDGSEYVATVIGSDSISDIAILKIEAENLTVAVCGNSDDLAVGESLVVVGNPLGSLGGTVTNGIVSATERKIQVNSVEMTLIQTNAAVNPGNSGGGMFNMQGQLIGIVNAKSTGTGIEGLGFAIPINEVLSVSEQLLEYGYVRGRTDIGVTFYEVENSMFQSYYNLKNGVYVSDLKKGYNDDVLEVGDRVIAVNDTEVTTEADIKTIVMSSEVGDKLVFQVYRDRKLIEVEVTCYESVPTDADTSVKFEGIG